MSDPYYHPLLVRQIKKYLPENTHKLRSFLEAVSDAYSEFSEDRKILERSLEISSRESTSLNEQLEAQLCAFPDAFVMLDDNGRIVDCRGRVSLIHKGELSTLIGRAFSELIPASVRPAYEELLLSVKGDRQPKILELAADEKGSGASTTYELRIVPGQARRLFVVVRDISERKILERQMAAAGKLISVGELSAGIAHEINTPVQYVLCNVEYLQKLFLRWVERGGKSGDWSKEVFAQKNSLQVEELNQVFKQTLEGLEHVTKIVSAIRSLSHPSEEPLESVCLREVINRAILLTCNEWKNKVFINCELPDDLPPVRGHFNELCQVFVNLIMNAIQAIEKSDRSGKIAITAVPMAKEIEIRVLDNGPGIPLAMLDRIFDPFFTTKDISQGTGLGLSLVAGMVTKRHKGSIRVESEEGEGATFILTIPRDKPGSTRHNSGSFRVEVVEEQELARSFDNKYNDAP